MKRKSMALCLVAALCLSSLLPVSGAAFSDGSEAESTENLQEAEVFESAPPQSDESYSDEQSEIFTADVEQDLLQYEYLQTTDSYRVTKGADLAKLDIPDTYQGKPVTEIGEGACAGFQNLVTVNLPDSITINKDAFAGCTNLRNVFVWNVKIGSGAFRDCPKLANLSCLDTSQQSADTIAVDAFDKDTKVTVYSYGSIPFLYDRGIYSADVESEDSRTVSGLSYYWETLTDFDDSYADVVVMEAHPIAVNKIETIGRKAFYGCEVLRSVELPDTIKTIESKAFYGCANLRKVLIPDSVTEISTDAFVNSPEVTISASEGSYAAKFAKAQGIPLESDLHLPDIGTVKATVNKNMVTVKVPEYTGDGYDCVLGTQTSGGAPVRGTGRVALNQNGNQVVFKNVPKGVYYLGIRPYSYENTASGKKYGEWTELVTVKITVSTPARPKIKSAVVSGKNLAVKVSLPKDAAGYNLWLGKSFADNDNSAAAIIMPTKTAYKKNGQKKTSVKLTNLKKGTYYVGIQTYNYQNGKKVYSKWSALKGIKIK
ncbi:leucine-rich repeat domain-containing protein [Blautia schinkii]|nr:leucine-rich repeat domain-containing protein [Blautia schinkii]